MNRHRFCEPRLLIVLAIVLVGALGLAEIRPAFSAESGTTNIRVVSPSGNTLRQSTGWSGREHAEPVVGQRPASTKTIKIGLLLPLTGRSADLGRAMQDAATVALFDKYARISPQLAAIRVELLPKDTGDTPEQATQAMREALASGVSMVIGPLFSESAAAITPLAAEGKVSVISFSNNPANAKPGVYPYGFSPKEQSARVVSFALRKGKTRIAALVPSSSLGDAVLEAANATLAATGTKLVAVARYAPQGVGIDRAMNALVPTAGAPNFDALLLPEGGTALGTILRALEARGVKQPKVQLLGTGIWDDASLVRRVNLDGAWLASSPPAATALFEKRFMATYSYMPPRIASLAYDAVSLAVTLATSDRGFDEAALTGMAGFAGPANGSFRLHPDGSVERSLAVLRVEGGSFSVIDFAPPGFTAPAAAK